MAPIGYHGQEVGDHAAWLKGKITMSQKAQTGRIPLLPVTTVGVDARAVLTDPCRGLGRVTLELIKALDACDTARVIVFCQRHPSSQTPWYSPGIRIVQLPQPRRGAWLWDGPAWRRVLARHPVDVLHLPAWGVPPGVPVPVVATLHDVTPIRHPKAIPSRLVRHRAIQRLGTYRRATLVHAVSRATARDAVHVLGIPPERVRVVHNGVNPGTSRPEGERPHVLFVGGGDPHKRVGLLIHAWSTSTAAELPPLVVAGSAGAGADVVAAARRHPDLIRAVGPVPEPELERLYREALAVLMPSMWEGFGLPALEAMANGAIPILTARSALPEAGGDGALYLPVNAPASAWVDAVLRLVRSPAYADHLRKRGARRARTATWEAMATGLVEVYREAAGRNLPATG